MKTKLTIAWQRALIAATVAACSSMLAASVPDQDQDWFARTYLSAQASFDAERYNEGLDTLRPVLASPRARDVLDLALYCCVGAGRYGEAEALIRAHDQPFDPADRGEYSSDSGRYPFDLRALIYAKRGQCPGPLWNWMSEREFAGLLVFGGFAYDVGGRRRFVPSEPSPKNLEFVAILRVAQSFGPQARERLFRDALAIFPEHPGTHATLAQTIARRAAFETEADGTPFGGAFNSQAEAEAYLEAKRPTMVVHITDEPAAREALAHYRLARAYAPDDATFRREMDGQILYWEHWLGIRG